VGGHWRREQIMRLEGGHRDRALVDLGAKTKVRQGSEGREFLLHRGMSQDEFRDHREGNFGQKTSWTPDPRVANEFSGTPGRDTVASAWIPEEHIHHVPLQIGSHKEDTKHPTPPAHRDEHEIIVNPHVLNWADESEIKQKPSIDTKITNRSPRQYKEALDAKRYAAGPKPEHVSDQGWKKAQNWRKALLGKSEPLAKGANGDWQKEGYTISHAPHGNSWKIAAFDKEGNKIGGLHVFESEGGGELTANHAGVSEAHRRKGIASGMYQYAEKITGMKFDEHSTEDEGRARTPDGKALWSQPNRSFGKSESLAKGANGDWQKEGYTLQHSVDNHGFHSVTAYDPRSNVVGEAQFKNVRLPSKHGVTLTDSPHHLQGWSVNVHPDHQRKGLASAMYQMAEKASGKKIIRGSTTPEGYKLWEGKKGKFGNLNIHDKINLKPNLQKSESLVKAFKSQYGGRDLPETDNSHVDRNEWWHGSPSGRFPLTGIHVGSHKAAHQALTSRIGHPVEGSWDGSREYGKTLLAGKKTLRDRGIYPTGYSSDGPEEDHYPTGSAKYGDKSPVGMTEKPAMLKVGIKGPMTSTHRDPRTDSKANASVRKNMKRGIYYVNEGEDAGSISAVVPSFDTHLVQKSSKPNLQKADHPSYMDRDWYHGTSTDAENLHPSKIGAQGGGVYYTSSPQEASGYAGDKPGANVRVHRVNVKNPFKVDMARGENIYEKLGMPNASDEVNNPAMIAKLKAMGHDSILATADDTAARKRFNLGSEGAIGPSYHLIPLDLAAIKNKFSKSDTMEVIKKSLARIRDLLE